MGAHRLDIPSHFILPHPRLATISQQYDRSYSDPKILSDLPPHFHRLFHGPSGGPLLFCRPPFLRNRLYRGDGSRRTGIHGPVASSMHSVEMTRRHPEEETTDHHGRHQDHDRFPADVPKGSLPSRIPHGSLVRDLPISPLPLLSHLRSPSMVSVGLMVHHDVDSLARAFAKKNFFSMRRPWQFRRVFRPPVRRFSMRPIAFSIPVTERTCGTRNCTFELLSFPIVPKGNGQDRTLSSGARRAGGHLPADREFAGGQHALPGPQPVDDTAFVKPKDPPRRSVAVTDRMIAAMTERTSARQEGEDPPAKSFGPVLSLRRSSHPKSRSVPLPDSVSISASSRPCRKRFTRPSPELPGREHGVTVFGPPRRDRPGAEPPGSHASDSSRCGSP